jgi:hypothetical protein
LNTFVRNNRLPNHAVQHHVRNMHMYMPTAQSSLTKSGKEQMSCNCLGQDFDAVLALVHVYGTEYRNRVQQ